MESILEKIVSVGFFIIRGLHIGQELATWIGHWLGRFLVVAIFIAAVVAVSFELSVAFNHPLFNESHWAYKIISLFDNQKTWVAVTAIVATTVAMGHFRTLDLNVEKAAAKSEERRKNQNREQ